VDLKAAAYVVEPGTNMKYFANINWSQSERPFLFVVQAKRDKTGQGKGKGSCKSLVLERIIH